MSPTHLFEMRSSLALVVETWRNAIARVARQPIIKNQRNQKFAQREATWTRIFIKNCFSLSSYSLPAVHLPVIFKQLVTFSKIQKNLNFQLPRDIKGTANKDTQFKVSNKIFVSSFRLPLAPPRSILLVIDVRRTRGNTHTHKKNKQEGE